MHPFARLAAVASIAAQRQGKFWEFHDLLFANYNRLNREKVEEIAKKVGLKMDRFETDMKDPEITSIMNRDVSEGNRIGVRGTPSVFVNGKELRNRSMEGFRAAISKELKTRKNR